MLVEPLTPLQAAIIAITAVLLLVLALIVKLSALRRAFPRFFPGGDRAGTGPPPEAYNFKLALKVRRPRLNNEDAGLDENELGLADALVRVAVPYCKSSFGWAVESVSVDSEGVARSSQARQSMERSGRHARQSMDSLTTPRGDNMSMSTPRDRGMHRRPSVGTTVASAQSQAPPAGGAASVLLKTSAEGMVWLQWTGDAAPVFEIQASGLHRNTMRALPISLAEARKLAQERAQFLVTLGTVQEKASMELGATASEVALDLPRLEIRLKSPALLKFAPRGADFEPVRSADRPIAALVAALRVCNRLLTEHGLPELAIVVEASTAASDAAAIELSKRRAATVKHAIVSQLRAQLGEDGRSGGPSRFESSIVTRAYGGRGPGKGPDTRIKIRVMTPQEARDLAESQRHLARAGGAHQPIAPHRRLLIQTLVRQWARAQRAKREGLVAHLATKQPLLVRPRLGQTRDLRPASGAQSASEMLPVPSPALPMGHRQPPPPPTDDADVEARGGGVADGLARGGGEEGGTDDDFFPLSAALLAGADGAGSADAPLLWPEEAELLRDVETLVKRVHVFEPVAVQLSSTGGGKVAHIKLVRRLRTRAAAQAERGSGARERERGDRRA